MAKAIDLDVIRGAEKSSLYPSEENRGNPQITKSLPGRVLTGHRERIDASKTTLFDGNPRNFSSNRDVSDLIPLVVQTGGNTQAVDARVVNGRVEVLAGSRRRQACIETGLKLTCDIWDDVTDEEARFIAEMENSGRLDIDFMGHCTYLASRYEALKKENNDLNVERFGQFYHLGRQHMQDKLSIGKLPKWLKDGAKPGAAWSHRQGQKLLAAYNKLREQEIDLKGLLEEKGMPFSTPSMLLAQLNKISLDVEGVERGEGANDERIKIGTGEISIKSSKRGGFEVSAKHLPEDAREAIIQFIRSLSERVEC